MLIYECIVSNVEMISDAYPQEKIEGLPESLFAVRSKIVAKGDAAAGIDFGNAFGGGEEEADDTVEKVNNLVDSFNYSDGSAIFSDKKSLKLQFSKYMKAVMKEGKMKKKAKDAGEGSRRRLHLKSSKRMASRRSTGSSELR